MLAFAVNLEYAVNTLFQIWTATLQALLKQLSHALCSVNQCVHLVQLPLCQALPTRRERRILIKFLEQGLHVGHAKTDRLSGLNKGQPAQNILLVASLPTNALWLWQESHAFIVPNSRCANASLFGDIADSQILRLRPLLPLDFKCT
jgi:hypothetical protein